MLARLRFTAGLAVVITIIALVIGLSLKLRTNPVAPQERISNNSESTTVVVKATSKGSSVLEYANLTQSQKPADNNHLDLLKGQLLSTAEMAMLDSLPFSEVRDVKLLGNRVLLATAGGVVEFYADDSSFSLYSEPQGLTTYNSYALLDDGEDIFVGTSHGVYHISGIGIVSPIWGEISDTVTVLKKFGEQIYVGTRTDGLYVITGDTIDQILNGKSITALTKNQFGLWVGTKEDGLLFSDGNSWRKCYLKRDSTLFANVTALESGYGRMWVGTTNGVFEYNGGAWTPIDSAANLYDQDVTAIAVGMKYIYFGTANSGVFCYDGAISPLDWTQNLQVRSLDVDSGNYLVGTAKHGATLKTKKGEYEVLPLIRQTSGILSGI